MPYDERFTRQTGLEPGGPATLSARLANSMIRAGLKSVWTASPATERGMRLVRRFTAGFAAAQTIPRGVEIVGEDFGRFGAEWVRAGRTADNKVLLYFHGGGYFFGGPRLYRPLTWRLAAATGRAVLAVDYRLAPENSPGDALIDALITYQSLLDRGYPADGIVLGGDSAGGHLVLALLLALKERDAPLPGAAVCISPWADVTCSAESFRVNRHRDALLPAGRLVSLGERFTAGKKPSDSLFSPVNGDYRGLPPLMVVSSDAEILRDDARTVTRLARAAGVEVRHDEWSGLVHVFPLFADFIPEGKAAICRIADFLR